MNETPRHVIQPRQLTEIERQLQAQPPPAPSLPAQPAPDMPINPQMKARMQALSDINQMHKDLVRIHQLYEESERNLAKERNLGEIMKEERDRYRRECHIFRDKCIELATVMANVLLQLKPAEDVMMSVRELTSEERTGEQQA